MHITDFAIWQLIVVFFSIFLAGVIDSIAGGGGIISIPAYLFLGLSGHVVLGTNKFSSTIGTFFATIRFASHSKINWRIGVVSVIFALVGSSIGSRLVLLIPVDFIRILLIILIPIIAVFTLLQKNENDNVEKNVNDSLTYFHGIKPYLISAAASLIIGMYDGFFGPGTGTFFILVYTTLLHFDMTTASGNAKVVNLSSNIAALATFLTHKSVFIELGVLCAICSVIGNWVGSGLAVKKGSKIIKPVFIIALLLLLSKVIYDLFLNK